MFDTDIAAKSENKETAAFAKGAAELSDAELGTLWLLVEEDIKNGKIKIDNLSENERTVFEETQSIVNESLIKEAETEIESEKIGNELLKDEQGGDDIVENGNSGEENLNGNGAQSAQQLATTESEELLKNENGGEVDVANVAFEKKSNDAGSVVESESGSGSAENDFESTSKSIFEKRQAENVFENKDKTGLQNESENEPEKSLVNTKYSKYSARFGVNGKKQFAKAVERVGAENAGKIVKGFEAYYTSGKKGLSLEVTNRASSFYAKKIPQSILTAAYFSGVNDSAGKERTVKSVFGRRETQRAESGYITGNFAKAGKLIVFADMENEIIERALESKTAQVRRAAERYSGKSFSTLNEKHEALGKLAGRMGITGEDIIRARAAAIVSQFDNAVKKKSQSFLRYTENLRKEFALAKDRLGTQAINFIDSVYEEGGISGIESFAKEAEFEYSKEDINVSVENFATEISNSMKKSGMNVSIEVYYDDGEDALRGKWVKNAKTGKTEIFLNGAALRGSEAASWVLAHELFHEAAQSNVGLSERIIYALEAAGIYDESAYEAYDELYRENYEKEFENLSEAEKAKTSFEEYAEQYVNEEIAADLMQKVLGSEELAEMFAAKAETKDLNFIAKFIRNFIEKIKGAFGKSGANERFVYSADSICGIFERAVKEKGNKKSSATTEQRFKLMGKNKDGIEVYETSEEIRSLSKKEKIQKFFVLMQNEYKGRTAKFVKDGKAYYARFAKEDLQKNIYGDKLSDNSGFQAKLNVGANGDIFTLAENSKYSGSKAEIGKNISAHRNVNEWDYFLKTVQIDGTTFDLVANVRKSNNKQFVYYLKLTENKNMKTSGPAEATKMGFVKQDYQRLHENIISQKSENVNSENEKNAKKLKNFVDVEARLAKKEKRKNGFKVGRSERAADAVNDEPFFNDEAELAEQERKALEKEYVLPDEAEIAMREQKKLSQGAPKLSEKRHELSIEERGKIETEIGKIAKELNVDKVEKKTFTSEVAEYAEKFVKDGNIKQEDVDGLAHKLYIATKVDTDISDFANTVRNAVKRINSTKLYISPEVRGDITDYREFAKKFGFSRLTKDSKNIPLDVFYAELQSEFPDLGLKKDAVLGDMLLELMRIKELGYETSQKQTVDLPRITEFDEAAEEYYNRAWQFIDKVRKITGTELPTAEQVAQAKQQEIAAAKQSFFNYELEKEADADVMLSMAKTEEEFEATSKELIAQAEKNFGKNSAEAMLQKELNSLSEERRRVLNRLGKVETSADVANFAPNESRILKLTGKLAKNLGFETSKADVNALSSTLFAFYGMIGDFIGGKTDGAKIVETARSIAAGIASISNVAAGLETTEAKTAFCENVAAKLISVYLQTGDNKVRSAVPSAETLVKVELSAQTAFDNIRDSIPTESAKELLQRAKELRGELLRINAETEKQKKQTAYGRLMEAQDRLFLKLTERAENAEKSHKEYMLSRRTRAEREKLFSTIRSLKKAKAGKDVRKIVNRLYGKYDSLGMSIDVDGVINLSEMKKQYEYAKENDPLFIKNKDIEEAIKRLEQKQIGNLPPEEVANVLETAHALSQEIKARQAAKKETRLEMLQNAADDTIDAILKSGGTKFEKPVRGALFKATAELLTPMNLIKKVCGFDSGCSLVKFTERLNDGQRKAMRLKQEFSAMFGDLVYSTDKEEYKQIKKKLSEFTGGKAKIQTYDIDGTEFRMTGAMKVSLYLSAQNEDFLDHVAGHGLLVPNVDLYLKGKKDLAHAKGTEVKLKGEFEQRKRTVVALVRQDGFLDEYEKAWAERIDKFLNVEAARVINDVTEELYGVSFANTDNYFKIFCNEDFNPTAMQNDLRAGVESFLKKRDRHIYKQVCVVDAVDFVEKQINSVSRYGGLAIPLRDFNDLYDTILQSENSDIDMSVKKAINTTWGPSAKRYIEQFVADLKSPRKAPSGGFYGLIDSLRSRRAAAVISFHMGVTVGNFMQYPQAASVLGWEAVLRGLMPNGSLKFDEEIVNQFTPLFAERRAGYTTRELGDIKSQNSFVQKAGGSIEKAFKIMQGVDVAVTKGIWRASEAYVRKNMPGLEIGSVEYYTAVANMFNETIEKTQPVYSTLQRPEVLRNNNLIVKELTMFKSPLMQNFNIMWEAVGEYHAAKKSGKNVAEAKAKLRRVLSSQIVAALGVAACNFVKIIFSTTGKRYRDDDDEVTALTMMTAFCEDFISNFTGMIPGLDEAISLTGTLAEKATDVDLPGDYEWYDMEINAFEVINEAVARAQSIFNATDKWERGEVGAKTVIGAQYKFAETMSQMLGVPLKNITDIFLGSTLFALEHVGVSEYVGRYNRLKWGADGFDSSVLNDMCKAAYGAYIAGDKESYKKIKNDILKEGYCTEKKFVDKMKSLQKAGKAAAEVDAFKNGEVEPSKVSDKVIKEVCSEEISKAVKYYEMGEKEKALRILETASAKFGFPLGRLKVIVKNVSDG